jgi:type VI secretion system protein ImpK
MSFPGYQNSLLLAQFREFYREVVREKRLATIGPVELAEPETRALAATAGSGRVAIAEPPTARMSADRDVWQKLLSVLERQALDAVKSGGAFGVEIYREAQYVMAALADEIFLHLEWNGRENWPLLESKLFRTHSAGEMFFVRLERLLQLRDPVYVDLAAVYFQALSLGFQGKYRDLDDHGQLQRYRQQLFAMIYRRGPQLFAADAPLFPQAYMHTLAGGKPQKLADPRNWFALLFIVFALWIAGSHFVWSRQVRDLNHALCHINPDDPRCPAHEQDDQ